MILVTLGTQDKQFARLLKIVENEIGKSINEEVIVQAGLTKYKSEKMKIFKFIDQNSFNKYIKEANLIITHGGVGSILSGIKNNKKVIACPRLSKYQEHGNDHQLEICNKFSGLGYIKVLNEEDSLGKLIKEMKTFKVKKYISNTKKIVNILENYIDNL